MDNDEQLKQMISTRVQELNEHVEGFRVEMLAKIEEAKTNQILAAIKALNNRLESIERRLPPEDE